MSVSRPDSALVLVPAASIDHSWLSNRSMFKIVLAVETCFYLLVVMDELSPTATPLPLKLPHAPPSSALRYTQTTGR